MEIVTTLTGRSIDWVQAMKATREGAGEIVPLVVRGKLKSTNSSKLCYGFFFRDKSGEFYDIFFARVGKPKRTASIDGVYHELLQVYDRAFGFVVPALTEENLIEDGKDLDPRRHRLVWMENPEDHPEDKWVRIG
ncbi:hypothetical protein EU803_14985 [Loktanella sp. IMCC34160]|uniref:hypothetical protein n=1 Tax=Loktanella sp. IMCC34160 TaxID=2510646 RepID=UPI00101CC02B|nr:hypothetical protein [Loktanella sp. IMCC34160]RYG89926.1 hypothetical protein EU803_14985 [Loktanella sp. IMCC34160]